MPPPSQPLSIVDSKEKANVDSTVLSPSSTTGAIRNFNPNSKQASSNPTPHKAHSFLKPWQDELAQKILEMLPTVVNAVMKADYVFFELESTLVKQSKRRQDAEATSTVVESYQEVKMGS
ncbi:hypothetical protein Adt_33198 [Abeliophyllum distichum]|uniref:Uncharacterized protein n=1 Tax=Abeliophyllum distichum TaxID=126358 RepID=A0ABD1QWV2_9LAMI